MSPLRTDCGGGGGGGDFALFTLAAPLPTGFLLGMAVGGLLILVNEGRAGRGASMTLVAMLDGTEAARVSFGGRAGGFRGNSGCCCCCCCCEVGRESLRTGRIT